MEEMMMVGIISYFLIGVILTIASLIPQIKYIKLKRVPYALWMALGYVIAWFPITIRLWWRGKG